MSQSFIIIAFPEACCKTLTCRIIVFTKCTATSLLYSSSYIKQNNSILLYEIDSPPKAQSTEDILTRVHSFNIHKHFINEVMLIFNNVASVREN